MHRDSLSSENYKQKIHADKAMPACQESAASQYSRCHQSPSHIINVQISGTHEDSSFCRGQSIGGLREDTGDDLSRDREAITISGIKPSNQSLPFDQVTVQGTNEDSDLRFSDDVSRPTECNPTILRTLKRMRIQRSEHEADSVVESVESGEGPAVGQSQMLVHQNVD